MGDRRRKGREGKGGKRWEIGEGREGKEGKRWEIGEGREGKGKKERDGR